MNKRREIMRTRNTISALALLFVWRTIPVQCQEEATVEDVEVSVVDNVDDNIPACSLQCLHGTECVRGNVSSSGQPHDPITGEVYFHNETSRDGWHCHCPIGLTGIRCGREFTSCHDSSNSTMGCYHGGDCISDEKVTDQQSRYW